ncbi:MAG: hypothetical protein NTW21_42570 [Verrucomicrobia bacterium]|nr:hypothetical protein [Verrucomicrobiota bacterium]
MHRTIRAMRRTINCSGLLLTLAVLGFVQSASCGSDLSLWYTSPGTANLTQGLLPGNGRMGTIGPVTPFWNIGMLKHWNSETGELGEVKS